MKIFPRCKIREYQGTYFVIPEDIVKLHGQEWYEKFNKLLGVHTCTTVPISEITDIEIKRLDNPTAIFTIYAEDYNRFADLIDKGKPTYWD